MTEFVIVLNTQRALDAFLSGGNVSLGGNLSVAVGPIGRTAEADAAANSKKQIAAVYSYSLAKGKCSMLVRLGV